MGNLSNVIELLRFGKEGKQKKILCISMILGHHTERQVSVAPGKPEHLVCWEENTVNRSLFLCELQWRHDLNNAQCT